MAGKNKTLRWMRLYVGGYDLSGDSRTFSSLDNFFDEADLTGWNEAVYNFLAGSPRHTGVRGYQALLNDTASSGAHSLLKQVAATPNTNRLSLLFGGGAAPAIADPAYIMASAQMGDVRGLEGLSPILTCDFLPDAAQFTNVEENPFGVVLHPATSLSATTNGTSVNNGGSSANGGHANLHITVTSGGTWAFKIQHSPNDSAWADLITFTADGSAITSEQGNVSGTIDQYTRFVATRTSGTVTPICTLARN